MGDTERFKSIAAMLRRRRELEADGRTYIQTMDRYGVWSGFCTFYTAPEQKARGVAEQPLYLELIGCHELIAGLSNVDDLIEDSVVTYCRVGGESDVEVLGAAGKWECFGCAKTSEVFSTRRDLYNHLVDHVSSGQRVPGHVLPRLAREINAEIEAATPKWTEEEAKDLLDKLSLFYGEPVKPISQYCRAFRTWQGAVEAAAERESDPALKTSFEGMVRDIRSVSVHVGKSNLLARLLYAGEELRTEPCPIHKGRWSGCVWGDGRCPHCMSGDSVTGWVRA